MSLIEGNFVPPARQPVLPRSAIRYLLFHVGRALYEKRFLIKRELHKNRRPFVANKTKKTKQMKKPTGVRRLYSKDDLKTLKAHSKAKTPVEKIAKLMKRSAATLRQKAASLGFPLGHRR